LDALGGGIDVRILQRYPRVGDISLSKKKKKKKTFPKRCHQDIYYKICFATNNEFKC
jgi:hypothetical protein